MEYLKNEQVYHILQNLSNLEIAYTEYSKTSPDFRKYDTYLDYFNNYVIRSHNLGRFYFPVTLTKEMKLPTYITDLPVIPESLNFPAGYDISIGKVLNSPDRIRHKSEYYTLVHLMSGSGALQVGGADLPTGGGRFLLGSTAGRALHRIPSRKHLCCFNFRSAYMKVAHQDFFPRQRKDESLFCRCVGEGSGYDLSCHAHPQHRGNLHTGAQFDCRVHKQQSVCGFRHERLSFPADHRHPAGAADRD